MEGWDPPSDILCSGTGAKAYAPGGAMLDENQWKQTWRKESRGRQMKIGGLPGGGRACRLGRNFFFFSWYIYFSSWVFCVAFRLSLLLVSKGSSLVAVHRLLISVASLVAEHRLQGTGSVVAAHGPGWSVACGIFLDQGSDWCYCALQGRFLTTGPPRKPPLLLFVV